MEGILPENFVIPSLVYKINIEFGRDGKPQRRPSRIRFNEQCEQQIRYHEYSPVSLREIFSLYFSL